MEYVAVICALVALICGVTAVIDMMMNGARHAGWAGYGLTIAFVCGSIAYLIIGN